MVYGSVSLRFLAYATPTYPPPPYMAVCVASLIILFCANILRFSKNDATSPHLVTGIKTTETDLNADYNPYPPTKRFDARDYPTLSYTEIGKVHLD